MNPFWKKTIIHVTFVGVSLAIIGHLLGRAFLMAHQMYSGGAYNPENERVLWQTPLVMSLMGIFMTGGLDFILRRRQPITVKVQDTNKPVSSI